MELTQEGERHQELVLSAQLGACHWESRQQIQVLVLRPGFVLGSAFCSFQKGGLIQNSSFDAVRLFCLILGHLSSCLVVCYHLGEECGSRCSQSVVMDRAPCHGRCTVVKSSQANRSLILRKRHMCRQLRVCSPSPAVPSTPCRVVPSAGEPRFMPAVASC